MLIKPADGGWVTTGWMEPGSGCCIAIGYGPR